MSDGTDLNAIGCGFFLQKTEKSYLAAFTAQINDIKECFSPVLDFESDPTQLHASGTNIAAIKLTL